MNFNSYNNSRNFSPRENGSRNSAAFSAVRASMTPFPAATPVGMAYVPFQNWGEINSPEKALASGTLFPELCFPFQEGGRR
ncbi:MAG: spore coat associated protein CotJA [Alistipes sp.]|nr:spore coat associated protein CotJA [Alistipes sp.]